MYSFIKIISQIFLLCIFFLSCENDPINISSDYIQSNVDNTSFHILNDETCNFQSKQFRDCNENLTNIDSLQIIDSYRIYSGKPIDGNDQFQSYAIFNIDLSKTSNDLSCISDNFSSAKIEFSSFNQLKDEEFNDETELDEVLEYYIDQSGIDIYLGHLDIDWSNLSNLALDDFISSNNFEATMTNVDFSLGEYDITVDSLQNHIDNFCSLNNLDVLIMYENSSDDDDIKNYLELVSSNYIFQPSQPQLYIDYDLLEQETIVENKFILESVFENNQSLNFNVNFEDDPNSSDWGKFLVANSEDLENANMSSLSIDSIFIDSPIVSNIPDSFTDFDLNFTFSIDNSNIIEDNFLPIEFYIDNLVGYVESSDPLGDNWQDCGSDSDCSIQDEDGSQGNGVWDIGEGTELNGKIDWIDSNLNNRIDIEDCMNDEDMCEIWFDDGQDLKPDSIEYLDAGSFLSNNIIHDSGLSADFYLDQDFSADISDLIDDSKDLNIWFSSITTSSNPEIYEAKIGLRLKKPAKAIEFKVSHSPNIYLDSIENSYTSIFYGGSDSLINDISVYNIPELNTPQSSNNIMLNYGQGIKSHLDFEGLSNFIDSDSSILIDKNNSSLILYSNYIDNEYYFESGFADIYFSDQNIFLKRIYFDNMDSVSIPIGDLMQRFVDKEFDYNGINLEIDGNGYNFNRPIFYKSNVDENSVYNPKLNIMYAK